MVELGVIGQRALFLQPNRFFQLAGLVGSSLGRSNMLWAAMTMDILGEGKHHHMSVPESGSGFLYLGLAGFLIFG